VRPGRDADPSPPSSSEVKNRAFVAYERVKPTYKQTVGQDMNLAKCFVLLQNGFVSGIPELSKFAFSLVFSTTADYMLRKECLSITAVRKLSVATS
jgi:hypothetical protein